MTLIDAIKSGRPFKRKNDEFYCVSYESTEFALTSVALWSVRDQRPVGLTVADLQADDWEIQEPKVTITRVQFWEAFRDARSVLNQDYDGETVLHMARKLGLED